MVRDKVPMILYGYIQDHQLQSDEVTKRSDIYHCPAQCCCGICDSGGTYKTFD